MRYLECDSATRNSLRAKALLKELMIANQRDSASKLGFCSPMNPARKKRLTETLIRAVSEIRAGQVIAK
jgi:hypothetical protein